LATRLFAPRARVVCTTFPQTEGWLQAARVVATGLPLRPGFVRREPRIPPQKLLITGGSQGARHINETVWAALDGLTERFKEVIHVTGLQGAEESQRYRRPSYRPVAFASDMPALLAEADLVLSRAGVGTIFEVAAVGLPSILVPGTFGGGHQEENARAMVEAGAAARMGDEELSPGSLLTTLDSLTPERLRVMAAAAARLARPDAAQRVLQLLFEVSKAA
jgi:UDP-N-acetylglucosamine--N-acetylmuramyl-(pentapeptide) pyrophosphoryl-undecaprenol N-acetylglucosamine transferase